MDIKTVSIDATNILNMLLLYKIASKTLQKPEIDIILEEGIKTIRATYSPYLDDNILEKILVDVKANIKDTINTLGRLN